jgi:hypothetical protein
MHSIPTNHAYGSLHGVLYSEPYTVGQPKGVLDLYRLVPDSNSYKPILTIKLHIFEDTLTSSTYLHIFSGQKVKVTGTLYI